MVALAVVMLITLVRFAAVAQFDARQDRYLDAKAALATSRQSMLDQQTGLRGWQLSGDRRFLAPYLSARAPLERADATLLANTSHDPRLAALALSNWRDQQAWIDLWVPRALDTGPGSRSRSQISLNLEGKRLFDDYRQSAATLFQGIDGRLAVLHRRDWQLSWFGAIAQLLVALFALLSSRRQLRRLHGSVALPLRELLVVVRRVREGDLSAVARANGPTELREIAVELAETTEALAAARARGDQREAQLATQAESSERVLELAREFNATLDLAAASESVVNGTLRLSGFPSARVWLADADRPVLRLSRAAGEVVEPSSELLRLGEGLGGRTAQHGQTMFATDEGVGLRRPGAMLGLALPMIAGGRTIGVVELSSPQPVEADNASLHLLETLTTHAALALEAARLHRQAQELGRRDALTGLLNRRQLDADIAEEGRRGNRYDRPWTFVLCDVDHFKSLNDQHGHLFGDEVLRDVAVTLRDGFRDTDAAYRYGGEEFALLLRETDMAAATAVVERLRSAIEQRFAGYVPGGLTLSFGLASGRGSQSPAELIAAADAAMYRAKGDGRNCWRVAEQEPTAMQLIPSARVAS